MVRRQRLNRYAVWLAALGMAACQGPDVTYVKSGDVPRAEASAFFKLPDKWTLYDQDEIAPVGQEEMSAEERNRLGSDQWLVIFDASPDPAPEHLSPFSEWPTGFSQVRALSPLEGEYTLESLRNEVFPLDQLQDDQDFTLLSDEALDLPGDMQGFRLSFSFGTDQRASKVQQVGVLDPAADVIYLLVISCEATCYDKEEKAIDRVVQSWRVEGALK
jgi:hypothetical protein